MKIDVPGKLIGAAVLAILLMAGSASAQDGGRAAEGRTVAPDDTLGTELALLFDARLERAGVYSDWVYEWAASYIAAYKVAGRIIVSVAQEPSSWSENFQKPLGDYYGDEIRQRVTHPEQASSALVEIVDRHVSSQLFLTARTAALAACPSDAACRDAKVRAYDSLALDMMAQRRTPDIRAAQYAAVHDMLDTGASDTLYWFRAIRPLASRTIIFILRLTALASIGLLVSALLRQFTLPNIWPTQVITALVIAWGLDYVVHDIDRRLHREEFQAKFELVIDGPRGRVLDYVKDEIARSEQLLLDRIVMAGKS